MKKQKFKNKVRLTDAPDFEHIERPIAWPSLILTGGEQSCGLNTYRSLPVHDVSPNLAPKLGSSSNDQIRAQDDGNIDEDMLQEGVLVALSDDENARRPQRVLQFDFIELNQNVQVKIAQFNDLSPRGTQASAGNKSRWPSPNATEG